MNAVYDAILATIPPRAQCSANTLRDVIEWAQLREHERSELFRYGVRQGYLTALFVWEQSTLPTTKGSYLRCYRRTTRPIRGVA